jgi:predicted lipid-binding transport protein (Tim44 family)
MRSVVSVVNAGLAATMIAVRVARAVMLEVSVVSVVLVATMIAVRVASVMRMTPRRMRPNSAVQRCSPARVHVSTAKRSRLRHGKTVKSAWWMKVPFGVEDSKRDIEGAMTEAAMTIVANPDRDAPSAEGLRRGAAIETVLPSRQSQHCQTNLRVK